MSNLYSFLIIVIILTNLVNSFIDGFQTDQIDKLEQRLEQLENVQN